MTSQICLGCSGCTYRFFSDQFYWHFSAQKLLYFSSCKEDRLTGTTASGFSESTGLCPVSRLAGSKKKSPEKPITCQVPNSRLKKIVASRQTWWMCIYFVSRFCRRNTEKGANSGCWNGEYKAHSGILDQRMNT